MRSPVTPQRAWKSSGIPTAPVNLSNIRYTSTTQTTGGSTIDTTDILRLGGPRTGRLSWEELSR